MSEIECPYCKYGMEASGSREDDNGTWECLSCEKEFEVEVEYDPIYYVSCDNDLHDYDYDNPVKYKYKGGECYPCKNCSYSTNEKESEGEDD